MAALAVLIAARATPARRRRRRGRRLEFLMGDKARSITGTVLTVDAGSTA